MIDICCVGHITQDKVVNANAELYMPGGTAYYFSMAVSRLPVSYLLVTAIAPPEMHYVEQLRAKGIRVNVQPSKHTVYFENIYADNQDQRTQNVLATADSFNTDEFNSINARIFHLGPLLAGDISVDLIRLLAGKGSVSLDVQGYLRRVENKKVYTSDWCDKKEALQYVDILKADVAELKALTGCDKVADGVKVLAGWGVQEVVITNGSQGSMIWHEGSFYTIPAYPPPTVVDATGCGDTYMAGYLYRRSQGAGVQQAGEFAAAMAGLKTGNTGPFVGTGEDVAAFMKRESQG